MVVLILLGIIISEITFVASRAMQLGNQSIDCASEARLALDRIGLDLAALVKRPDVDFELQNAVPGPTNLLVCLSGVSSAASSTAVNRGFSIVAYQVNTHPDNLDSNGNPRICLTRAGKALTPDSTGFFGLNSLGFPILFTDPAFPSALLPTATASDTTNDYDILAPGVICLSLGVQLYPDNNPVTLQDNTSIANARGQVVYSLPTRAVTGSDGTSVEQMVDLTRVSAIVVGLAVLDLQNLQNLSSTQATTLANVFPLPTTAKNTNETPAQIWAPIAQNVNSFPASIPLAARQSVRIFQRFYPTCSFGNESP